MRWREGYRWYTDSDIDPEVDDIVLIGLIFMMLNTDGTSNGVAFLSFMINHQSVVSSHIVFDMPMHSWRDNDDQK